MTMTELFESIIDRTMYNALVMQYLEYLGYPHYIQEFDPVKVATRIAITVDECHKVDLVSPRMCALLIFGLTWTHGILPLAKMDNERMTKQ